ncbi:hypothetical protein C1922_03100 [Stenotrophomonas sp. ZAC14D2_NAIMI4_7]|nr:hypothetical protein C1922_03100 [Stenotrophomonas sp. ZAC14D2_NAIMI4_7]
MRGCPRHGCRGQAYRDVFTASPATGPTPPSPRNQLLTLTLPLIAAGAGLQALPVPHPPAGLAE